MGETIMFKFIFGMIVGGFIVNVNPDVVTTITNLMKEMLNAIQYNNSHTRNVYDCMFTNCKSKTRGPW